MANEHKPTAHHNNARKIIERIHISAELHLETPAHFGSGLVRDDALVDMSLLLDDANGMPDTALLTGATIAGALRSYLRERLHGYAKPEPDKPFLAAEGDQRLERPLVRLFGPTRQSEASAGQSLLIVDDARCKLPDRTLRDGVRINEKIGTAHVDDTGGAKFDVELLEAGTVFELHFEVLLTETYQADRVLPYVAEALQGLENGVIRLGLRKRRGYGQCRVSDWTVSRYDLSNPHDLCLWLETPSHAHREGVVVGKKIADVLVTQPLTEADLRESFTIDACFGLAGSSVLIRSGFGEADQGPDSVHLHALRNGERVPVIPGTSWAGIIRHRALRIANTIAQTAENNRAARLVQGLFGRMPEDDDKVGKASRVSLDETEIKKGQTLYQTRVRIDRFTGGAYEGALFEEAPVYGTDETRIGFRLHLRDPKPAEIGLLLLVLKDLWTGDLPVGGEAAVGRGRLHGISATLEHAVAAVATAEDHKQEPFKLHLKQNTLPGGSGLGLSTKEQEELQSYVDALWEHLGEGKETTDA